MSNRVFQIVLAVGVVILSVLVNKYIVPKLPSLPKKEKVKSAFYKILKFSNYVVPLGGMLYCYFYLDFGKFFIVYFCFWLLLFIINIAHDNDFKLAKILLKGSTALAKGVDENKSTIEEMKREIEELKNSIESSQ